MTLSEFSYQELDEQIRVYMASPEGGIRSEIHALDAFRVNSIRDLDEQNGVLPIDGYQIANLFWDLHQPTGIVPKFDDDLLESLEYHTLLSSKTWSLGNPWPEDCRKWVEDLIKHLTESWTLTLKPPVEPDWQDRSATLTQMMLLLPQLHDAEHIRLHALTRSDEDCEQFILECLDWLYERYKASYEPDGESSAFFELDAHAHIAAARAFRLKRRHGYSDEVMDCLADVESTAEHIAAEDGVAFPHGEELSAPFHSTQVAVALAFVELSRKSTVDGDFVDALHYLARAAKYYDFIAISNEDMTNNLDYMRFLYEGRFDIDLRLRRKLKANLTGLEVSLDEAANVFRAIKANHRAVGSWSQVVDDCRQLKNTWFVSGREDDVTDEHGDIATWEAFWTAAQTWAAAQLSPNDLVRALRGMEDGEAKDRLKNYFFMGTWTNLPPKAQERLTYADLAWNSPERGSGGPILGNLLTATEEMCEQFIFQQLKNEARLQSDILRIEARVTEDIRRNSLGIREYIRICNIHSLPRVLEELQLEETDIQFLTEKLPAAMEHLTPARNIDVHETGIFVRPELVTAAFRMFLGIGQRGILPDLARIGRKLQGRR